MYESTGAVPARSSGGGGVRTSGGGGGSGFSRPTPVRTVAAPAPVAASMPPAVRTTAPSSPWGGARPSDYGQRPSWGGQRPGRHDATRPSWTPGWSGGRPERPSYSDGAGVPWHHAGGGGGATHPAALPAPGKGLSPVALPPGAKPVAKPKPLISGAKPGKPKPGPKKPGGWPWWKPWYPHAGYWPDWAPTWWIGWGVVNADMLYVDDLPYVVVWIDRCSPEWAQAFAAGTAQLPTEYDGLPVIVRYTCGNLAEMESVPGTPAYGAAEEESSGVGSFLFGLGLGALITYIACSMR